MTRGLTDRQRQVFSFIRRTIREKGQPPSLKEARLHFGLNSDMAVKSHLTALEKKGYLVCRKRKARKIEFPEELDPYGVPVISRMSPGAPVATLEHIDTVLNPAGLFDITDDTFAVHMPDNSMEGAGIEKGDYVIAEAGEWIDDGTIGAVQMDGRIVVRRVIYEGAGLSLVGEGAHNSDITEVEYYTDVWRIGPIKGLLRQMNN